MTPQFLTDCEVMFGSFKDALHDHGVLSTPEIYHSGLSLTPHFSKAPIYIQEQGKRDSEGYRRRADRRKAANPAKQLTL